VLILKLGLGVKRVPDVRQLETQVEIETGSHKLKHNVLQCCPGLLPLLALLCTASGNTIMHHQFVLSAVGNNNCNALHWQEAVCRLGQHVQLQRTAAGD
jgi:hypothetical protein